MYVWFVVGVTSVFMISLSVCQDMPTYVINETEGNITTPDDYYYTGGETYSWEIRVPDDNTYVAITFDFVNLRIRGGNCHDHLQVFQFNTSDRSSTMSELTNEFCETTMNISGSHGLSLLIKLVKSNIGPDPLSTNGFHADFRLVTGLLTTTASYNSTTLEASSDIYGFNPVSTEQSPNTIGPTTTVDNAIKGTTLEMSSDVSGFNQLSTEPPPNTVTFTTAVNGGNKEGRTANSSISAAYIVVPLLIFLMLAMVAVGIVIRKRRRGLVNKQSSSPRSVTNTTYSQDHILATPSANNNLQGDDVVYNSAYESSNGIKPSTNSDDHREGQVYNTAYQSVDDKGQSSQDVNNQPEYNHIDTERLGGESAYNVAYEGFDGGKANGNVLSDSSEAGQSSQVKGSDVEYNYVAPEKLGGDSTYNVAYGGFTEDKTDNNSADDPAYLEIKDGDEARK